MDIPFGKELPTRLAVYFVYLCFCCFPFWFRGWGLVFHCSNSCSLLTCFSYVILFLFYIPGMYSLYFFKLFCNVT